ncbi:Uncharacterised protein [Zhongshania aliphaticivorans]|uniref:DUF2804 domain-containing protein n=1 Tax=Zhongshania aliphaticivorans TaxID=1470434 RepID=A0A5S9QJ93_9GAMM|nr:DUF2804 domain-containing protein [Zhongshania aliphaticivorans]CAA0110236.1 Uncharacterised protein [Zhongshania aliphaticivorans]CAA0118044.1 Uncharacterised protein [Zhongshania aliphaticivorans]CAA0121961.1 Uncharacterised protein [Zhongshania aliphaticivorans]
MNGKPALIGKNGQPTFGLFETGVNEVNFQDYDLRSAMDRKLGGLAKHFKFNQFQFVALVSPQLIVGVAIVDLKLVSNAFVYLYEPQTQVFEEFSFTQPLARQTKIETRPEDGAASFRCGKNQLSIKAQAGRREVSVSLKSGLEISASIDESNTPPLALCSRAGYQGWVYTRKNAAMPCEGHIVWGGKDINLAEIKALASVDWTAGYMRGETFWNWGSLSASLADGRRLGMNLAAGVNETGFTENALWLDDRLIKVDMVNFEFDRYQASSPWRMRSADGIVNIVFTPKGQRKEKINALFIASNFTQHFGVFNGEIRLADEVININNCWGFAEDHFARW